MPTRTELFNMDMRIEKTTRLDEEASTPDTPVAVEVWTLIMTDRLSHNQIIISFQKSARDNLVQQMLGGLVLPGTEGVPT